MVKKKKKVWKRNLVSQKKLYFWRDALKLVWKAIYIIKGNFAAKRVVATVLAIYMIPRENFIFYLYILIIYSYSYKIVHGTH